MQYRSSAWYARKRPHTAQRLVTVSFDMFAQPNVHTVSDWAVLSPAQPVRRIDGDAVVANLEMEVRGQLRIGLPDGADLLPLDHRFVLANRGVRQRTIRRVVAPAMIHD